MVEMQGSCDPGFEPVRDAFAAHFAAGLEAGAAVAVTLDGKPVVDLWAGTADETNGRPWERDTAAVVFSSTKGITAMCALLLWQRGDLDLDAPVAELWPEFAAGGKEGVTTRHLLTHQAGLPAFDDPISVNQCHETGGPARRLARQIPRWEPGTAHGYHAITFGWLVGEVVARATGRTVGRFFADEIAAPLGLDTWIGLPEELEGRVARLSPPVLGAVDADLLEQPIVAAFLDPSSLLQAVFFNPPILMGIDDFNAPAMHQAEWPAASGITSARSLARLYGELACDRPLDADTLDAAEAPYSDGPDRVLVDHTRFGLGFMLPCDFVAYGPSGQGFGHGGAGGSVGFADRRAGIGFGYVMNRMTLGIGPDARAEALGRAVYSCVGES
jgi:CubicO group peptidase (beta-lactamase class C family)